MSAPGLSPDVLKRLEQLLRGLPEWEEERMRRALLSDILRGQRVWDYLRLGDSVAVSAQEVVTVCQDRGPEALCVLVKGLGDRYKTDPDRRDEIGWLMGRLCVGSRRRRGKWKEAPYLGLNYFDRQHAPIFFGREAVLGDLVKALNKEQGRRFTVVLGASGSGKSSLVRAGLWAGLADGEIAEMPGSREWLICAMTPSDGDGDPMAALRAKVRTALQEHEGFRSRDWNSELKAVKGKAVAALAERVLASAPSGAQWLLILDQMEELFAEPRAVGAAFLDELIQATQTVEGLRVVATLRNDFYHHASDHPPLLRVLNGDGGAFHVGPPDRRSLERMVSGPLTEVDLVDGGELPAWYVDPELPAAIAAEAHQRPGGLALMAFALRELWEACRGSRRMELATYQSAGFGGLAGAVARKADETLRALGQGGEGALKRVFCRLVRVSLDDAPARRRERISAWKDDAGALQAIEQFQKARLLVTDRGETADPVVEVAHEALLREWPKLAEWIASEREAFQLAERVRAEARAWGQGNWRETRQRPFAPDHVDRMRERLEAAGLLAGLVEDEVVRRLLTPEVDWILEEVAFSGTSNLRRWQIGRRLAEIGDPRPGVGVRPDGVPDILWQPIPAGTVEIKDHGAFQVEPFEMAAYAITASQFLFFVQARDGYDNKR